MQLLRGLVPLQPLHRAARSAHTAWWKLHHTALTALENETRVISGTSLSACSVPAGDCNKQKYKCRKHVSSQLLKCQKVLSKVLSLFHSTTSFASTHRCMFSLPLIKDPVTDKIIMLHYTSYSWPLEHFVRQISTFLPTWQK